MNEEEAALLCSGVFHIQNVLEASLCQKQLSKDADILKKMSEWKVKVTGITYPAYHR